MLATGPPSAAAGLLQPLGARPSLYSGLFRLSRPHQRADPRRRLAAGPLVVRSLGDPWKTLGLSQNASEKEIKRAHRKLVLLHHPDISKDDPAAEARFLAVQEAYEIIMGRRRGKELDASPTGNDWQFHDWYWRFTMSKRWGRSKKARGGPNPFASATPPPGSQWKSQLDGLKRKAAAKRTQHGRGRPSSGEAGAAAPPPPPHGPAAGQAWAGVRGGAGKGAGAAQAQQRAQPPPAEPRPEAATASYAAHQQPAANSPPARGPHPDSEPSSHAAAAQGNSRAAAAAAQPQHAAPEQHLGWQPEASLGWQPEASSLHAAAAAAAAADAAGGAGEEEERSHVAEQPPLQHPSPLDHHQPELPHQEQLLHLVGQLQLGVHRLREQSGGALQNHIVRLVRHASQLGQHLQVQLVRLRAVSTARQGGAQHMQQAQHAELHVEFEETLRLRQHQAATGAAAHGARFQHSAPGPSGAGQAAPTGAARDQEQQGRQEQQQGGARGRRFVNDGRVRERVSSQLAGLRRRAAIRQEFDEE